jgi:O-antigen ligase
MIGLFGTNWDNKFAAIGAITGRIPAAIRGLPGAEGGFNTNAVAGCLLLFIPLQLGLLATRPGWLFSGWTGHRRLMILEGLLLMLTAGTLVLTESRTAWISIGVAGLVFLVWYRRWTQVLVTAGAAAGAALVALVGIDPLSDFIVSRSGPAFVSTFDLRLKLWKIGLMAMQEYKFTGMGLNVFRKLLPIRYPDNPALPGEELSHVHNHLLQAGVDLGVPGLIAYLAIWIVAGSLLVQVYRRSEQSIFRVLAGGLGAGLVAHFVFGMADVIPLGAKVGVLFWLTLAFTVALHRIALTRSG